MKNLISSVLFILLLSNTLIGQIRSGNRTEIKVPPPAPAVDPRALFPGKNADSDHGKEYEKGKSFSAFAEVYVSDRLDEWKKKGEFEKTIDWEKRVTEESIKQKRDEYTEDAVDAYVESLKIRWEFGNEGTFTLGQYNADKETFTVKSDHFGDFQVPVPIDEAKDFKYNQIWDGEPTSVFYFIINDKLGLAEATFFGKYKYVNPLAENLPKTKEEFNPNLGDSSFDILAGRTVVELPRPSSNFRDEGKVVVLIYVDRNGNVIRAIPGASGTTTNNKQLLDLSYKAALQAKFSPKRNAPEEQMGSITYVFELN